MKNNLVVGAFLLGSTLTLGSASVNAALVLDPADCGTTLDCITGTETSQSEIDAIMAGMGLTLAYKSDQGGGDSGPYAGDYTTTFSMTPTDPMDADVVWNGGDSIACPSCSVLVKDGDHQPAWYLINIDGWDGEEALDLNSFWVTNGAISHVSIYQGVVPVPAAVWLFGSGLLGLVGVARRKSRT